MKGLMDQCFDEISGSKKIRVSKPEPETADEMLSDLDYVFNEECTVEKEFGGSTCALFYHGLSGYVLAFYYDNRSFVHYEYKDGTYFPRSVGMKLYRAVTKKYEELGWHDD